MPPKFILNKMLSSCTIIHLTVNARHTSYLLISFQLALARPFTKSMSQPHTTRLLSEDNQLSYFSCSSVYLFRLYYTFNNTSSTLIIKSIQAQFVAFRHIQRNKIIISVCCTSQFSHKKASFRSRIYNSMFYRFSFKRCHNAG